MTDLDHIAWARENYAERNTLRIPYDGSPSYIDTARTCPPEIIAALLDVLADALSVEDRPFMRADEALAAIRAEMDKANG